MRDAGREGPRLPGSPRDMETRPRSPSSPFNKKKTHPKTKTRKPFAGGQFEGESGETALSGRGRLVVRSRVLKETSKQAMTPGLWRSEAPGGHWPRAEEGACVRSWVTPRAGAPLCTCGGCARVCGLGGAASAWAVPETRRRCSRTVSCGAQAPGGQVRVGEAGTGPARQPAPQKRGRSERRTPATARRGGRGRRGQGRRRRRLPPRAPHTVPELSGCTPPSAVSPHSHPRVLTLAPQKGPSFGSGLPQAGSVKTRALGRVRARRDRHAQGTHGRGHAGERRVDTDGHGPARDRALRQPGSESPGGPRAPPVAQAVLGSSDEAEPAPRPAVLPQGQRLPEAGSSPAPARSLSP